MAVPLPRPVIHTRNQRTIYINNAKLAKYCQIIKSTQKTLFLNTGFAAHKKGGGSMSEKLFCEIEKKGTLLIVNELKELSRLNCQQQIIPPYT
jgi:hypothetical protein